MQYTTLGKTGLVVSRLAFGAMTFGVGEMLPGVSNNIDQPLADRMVSRALDAGVNIFDTADAYMRGVSETMLGKALGQRRPEAIVATKVGFRTGDALTGGGGPKTIPRRGRKVGCDDGTQTSLSRLDAVDGLGSEAQSSTKLVFVTDGFLYSTRVKNALQFIPAQSIIRGIHF